MKELAKRVEEKLKKFEQIAEVKYFNRLEVFHRQAEKEVREEIELGFRERKRNNISIKFLSDKIMILDLGGAKND